MYRRCLKRATSRPYITIGRQHSRKDVTRHEANVARSPILKRQEVSSQFGKMNAALHAMLDESAKGVENVDALALNDGLESM